MTRAALHGVFPPPPTSHSVWACPSLWFQARGRSFEMRQPGFYDQCPEVEHDGIAGCSDLDSDEESLGGAEGDLDPAEMDDLGLGGEDDVDEAELEDEDAEMEVLVDRAKRSCLPGGEGWEVDEQEESEDEEQQQQEEQGPVPAPPTGPPLPEDPLEPGSSTGGGEPGIPPHSWGGSPPAKGQRVSRIKLTPSQTPQSATICTLPEPGSYCSLIGVTLTLESAAHNVHMVEPVHINGLGFPSQGPLPADWVPQVGQLVSVSLPVYLASNARCGTVKGYDAYLNSYEVLLDGDEHFVGATLAVLFPPQLAVPTQPSASPQTPPPRHKGPGRHKTSHPKFSEIKQMVAQGLFIDGRPHTHHHHATP